MYSMRWVQTDLIHLHGLAYRSNAPDIGRFLSPNSEEAKTLIRIKENGWIQMKKFVLRFCEEEVTITQRL